MLDEHVDRNNALVSREYFVKACREFDPSDAELQRVALAAPEVPQEDIRWMADRVEEAYASMVRRIRDAKIAEQRAADDRKRKE